MIIKNGKIITWGNKNEIIKDRAIYIKDGVIKSITSYSSLVNQYPEDEVLDARNQYVMPGNICAHTHFYGAFSRGMAIPGEPAKGFTEILEKLWWKLDKALDYDGVRYSTLVCLIDAIKHGTTTLFDHHASPNAIDGSLDVIAEEVLNSGLRASLCYEVTDRDGEKRASAGIYENERFISKVQQGLIGDRIKAHFGLHASLTISKKTLEKCLEACPDSIGFHTHAAEGIADQEDSLAKYGKRVIERFAETGVLKKNSILAHGVHANFDEIELLATAKTWLTHQPRSNMNNAVGVAPIEEMLSKGVRVALGNDGFSNSMWDEWKAAYLIHKDQHHDPRRMNGYDLVKIAVENNAELARQTFDGLTIGAVTEGAAADLIFVDYYPFTPLTAGNLPWHILFGFRESQITTTIVAGKVLMKDRKLTTLDEEKISFEAMNHAQKTWERIE